MIDIQYSKFLLLLFLFTLPACPFEFSETKLEGASCTQDSDCGPYESCSARTKFCSFQIPEVKPDHLVGPFHCPLNILPQAPVGQLALQANWSEFSSEEIGNFPAGEGSINHTCIGEPGLSENQTVFLIQAYGARYLIEENYYFLFSKFLLYEQDLDLGDNDFEGAVGLLYLCPGFPSELAWSSFMTDNCLLFQTIGQGNLKIDELVYEGAEPLSVRGYIDMRLYP